MLAKVIGEMEKAKIKRKYFTSPIIEKEIKSPL